MLNLENQLSWLPASIAEFHPAVRNRAIVDLVLDRLSRWRLDELFPGIEFVELPAGVMPQRLANAIDRQRTGVELGSLSVDDLLLLPGVGVTSVRAYVEHLVALADRSPRLGEMPRVASDGPRHRAAAVVAEEADALLSEEFAQTTLRTIAEVARWNAVIGALDRPLLVDGVGEPAAVRIARGHLQRINAADVLVSVAEVTTIAQLLGATVQELDERALLVLRERLFSERPVTLDELGQRLGVTRERVRQIEGKARAVLWREVTTEEPLSHVVLAVAESVGRLSSLTALLNRFPALAEPVVPFDRPAWSIIDRLDDQYEIENGWAAPDLRAAVGETRDAVSAVADQHGVARIGDILQAPSLLSSLTGDELRAWLEHCGLAVLQEHVLLRTRGMLDWAAALLDVSGVALTAEQIDANIPNHDQVRSLKNALLQDARFVPTTRDRWALVEWGSREYRGLAEEIGRVVDERGGKVPLRELRDELVGQFGVAPSSVYTYATRGGFGVERGMVQRVGKRELRTTKSPYLTKRVYRARSAWIYRIDVTHEHLRGSGFPLPIGLGAAVGVVDDEPVAFEAPERPQVVQWNGAQVTTGSVRRFLELQDAQIGDAALLMFEDAGSFDVEVVGHDGLKSERLLERVASLAETRPGEDLVPALAVALGLEAASVAEVLERLEQRDEQDLADLLQARVR